MSFSLTKKGTTGTTVSAARICFPGIEGKSAHVVSIGGYGTAAGEKVTIYSMSAFTPAATADASSTGFNVDSITGFTNAKPVIVQNTSGHVFTRVLSAAPTLSTIVFTQALSATDPVAVDDKVWEMDTVLADFYLMEQLQRQSLAGPGGSLAAGPKGSPILVAPGAPSTTRVDHVTVEYR